MSTVSVVAAVRRSGRIVGDCLRRAERSHSDDGRWQHQPSPAAARPGVAWWSDDQRCKTGHFTTFLYYVLYSGKSGPKDQVALRYYCASPSIAPTHWCTTHDPLLPLVLYVFDGLENFSLHFIAQQLKIQMRCVQYATYNSLGGCSKARSALTTAPSNEKEKK